MLSDDIRNVARALATAPAGLSGAFVHQAAAVLAQLAADAASLERCAVPLDAARGGR
jgi:hypothetical protein